MNINNLTIGEAKELMGKLNLMFGPCDDDVVNTESVYKSDSRAVVVFSNNAIIFGYTDATKTGDVTLTNARNCYYYTKQDDDDKKGFIGLAEHGPATGSKVGATASKITVNACCIQDCSIEAVKIWESSKWG